MSTVFTDQDRARWSAEDYFLNADRATSGRTPGARPGEVLTQALKVAFAASMSGRSIDSSPRITLQECRSCRTNGSAVATSILSHDMGKPHPFAAP
jgi:hypothetical protein